MSWMRLVAAFVLSVGLSATSFADEAWVSGGKNAETGVNAQSSGSNEHGSYNAQANATANAGYSWSVGPNGLNVESHAHAGADASVDGEIHGQYGDDQNNIHGQLEGKLTAEAVADALAKANIDPSGVDVGASGKLSASLSATAEATGGVTIFGIPIDAKLGVTGYVGAELSGEASVKADRDTGKVTVKLQGGAAFLLGGGAYTEISIGFGKALGPLLDALFPGEDAGADDGSGQMGKPGDEPSPFDSQPEGGTGDSSGKKEHFQGLKPIKLFD